LNDAGKRQRGTIFVEDAAVLSQHKFAGQQYIIRLHAPRCAAKAQPGSFIHICCDQTVPMRRPLSIMRANADDGWIDLLYKVIGDGLRHLATRKKGDLLNIIGPIGHPFVSSPDKSRPLLIGGGVGVPPLIFLAEILGESEDGAKIPVLLMGSELPFPFETEKSTLVLPGAAQQASHGMSLMESAGIASRLASGSGFPGCFRGLVTALARDCLQAMSPDELALVEVFACGPEPMLEATAKLASEFSLPCQLFPGRIYGLRGRRLRRLHGGGSHRKRNGHAQGLRRRAGFRCPQYIPRLATGAHRTSAIQSGCRYPKLIFVSRLVLESALTSASSSSMRPSR